MDSNNLQALKEYLAAKKVWYVTDIRRRSNDDVVLLTVPELSIGNSSSAKSTSRRQLSYLAKAIKRDLSINVDFLITKGEVQEAVETGLKALLQVQYPNVIRYCFTSASGSNIIDVWLESEVTNLEEIAGKLKQVVRAYLKAFQMKLGTVRWSEPDEHVPSDTAILKELKTIAPALATDLAERLKKQGFRIPSLSWVETKLDTIRRRQHAIRREDGRYVLTELGLKIVPHRRGSQGSDVIRALALGRRKWYDRK